MREEAFGKSKRNLKAEVTWFFQRLNVYLNRCEKAKANHKTGQICDTVQPDIIPAGGKSHLYPAK